VPEREIVDGLPAARRDVQPDRFGLTSGIVRRRLVPSAPAMPDLVLSTLNARYIHASFALRYLFANLGELAARAEIVEFEIRQTPLEIVEALLARRPRVVALGIYIWNVRPSLEVVILLKRLAPGVLVVLGGPEVSHETDDQEIVRLADHTITGEADRVFAALCRSLLAPVSPGPDSGANSGCDSHFGFVPGQGWPRVIAAPVPDLGEVALPYEAYTEADLANRILYVEASRGCPFTCEFCLSSLDIPVRPFPLDRFLEAMGRLLDRGARQFKFVDRTFNLNLATSRAILRFFRNRWRDGLFLHFEMIPDRLPEPLRKELAWFPAGAVQLEVGIQSFNPEVCGRIGRRQDAVRTEENLRFLREHTGVHVHADLIAGLPGESLESFAAGFDRLVALGPQEIQLGILKRLRGTPISRHDGEWGMCYSPLPPYEILANRLIGFPTLQRLRRFARYWDLVANSGRFSATTPRIWHGGQSPFGRFLAFSDWLYATLGQTHAIAHERLAQALFSWLATEGGLDRPAAADALATDWARSGRRDLPAWLDPNGGTAPVVVGGVAIGRAAHADGKTRSAAANRRQARHRGQL
jgi:radical SAM superfamily enzyme YgiQ (UPF0313 family)